MDKIYFYEKISDETLKRLDDFLSEHPTEKVTYWVWREALELTSEVHKELAESVKEFGEKIDKILGKYNPDELMDIVYMNKVNAELEKLAVVPNVPIYKKLEELCKKRYY